MAIFANLRIFLRNSPFSGFHISERPSAKALGGLVRQAWLKPRNGGSDRPLPARWDKLAEQSPQLPGKMAYTVRATHVARTADTRDPYGQRA